MQCTCCGSYNFGSYDDEHFKCKDCGWIQLIK